MPRNQTGLTEDERAAVVTRAHELLAEGKSAAKAATETAAETGVSASSVRRYCESVGRPLTQPTPEARARTHAARIAARRTRTLIAVDRQRELTQELLRIAEDEVYELAKQQPGATDHLALNRLANTVARLMVADAALLARLGPRHDETPAPSVGESVEEAAERIMAKQWEQWHEDRSAIGDEDD
ncbi:MAG: hypothetical protein NUW01_03715 [Gemmatimonadaceae bacterium]|nr:hypothetical protein [Gemmatimonadaceae bacterium]